MAETAISAEILTRGQKRVFLATHAWHMKRANAAFEGNGVLVTSAPTAPYLAPPDGLFSKAVVSSLATFRMWAYASHEIVRGLWYGLGYGC